MGIYRGNKLMTTRDLLEIIGIIGGIIGAAATGGFTFATSKYLGEIKDLQRQIANSFTKYNDNTRKMQQNLDRVVTEQGILKCDIRDIKGALMRNNIIHERAGYPEENIPRRTDWGAIDDA